MHSWQPKIYGDVRSVWITYGVFGYIRMSLNGCKESHIANDTRVYPNSCHEYYHGIAITSSKVFRIQKKLEKIP